MGDVSPKTLRAVPLLSSLSDRELKQLSREVRQRNVAAGTKIVKEGEGGAAFFIVTDGEAGVTIKGRRRGKLKKGDYFGEVALLGQGERRAATVTALTDVQLIGISVMRFRSFVKEHPEVGWKLLQGLASRLRDAGRADSIV